jgi:hypothetical protein
VKRGAFGLVIAAGGVALVGWAASADVEWAERHVLSSYCATSAPAWIAAHVVRWVVAGVGVAAVLAAPAAARLLGGVRLRAPSVGGVVGVAIAIAASLLTGEAVMRSLYDRLAKGARPAPAGGRPAAPMTRPDPALGWSYIPVRTTWIDFGGRRIAYAIDAEGSRARSADDRRDPSRPTILFAGESIAFGYGLAYEETLPFLVGHDMGVQTANLAVVGYGNDQAYLRVLDALERVPHPLAVVTLFIPDQIRRNVDIWRPRLVLGPSGELLPVPAASGPRIAKLLQELPWHGDAALRLTAAILRATAEAARVHGAVPLFVVTNYGAACLHDDGGEPWIVKELFARQGLPFVRVDLDPDDRLPGAFERHPSPRGARKIAAAVERALADALGARLVERGDGGDDSR